MFRRKPNENIKNEMEASTEIQSSYYMVYIWNRKLFLLCLNHHPKNELNLFHFLWSYSDVSWKFQFFVLGRPRPGPSGRPWKVNDFIFHDVSSLKYKHRFGFGRSFKVTIGGVTLNPNPYQAYQNVLRTWTAEILIPPL